MNDIEKFTPRPWSDGQMSDLKRLVGDGLTASQIAAQIGKSRNSVIGMARRQKLVWGGSVSKQGVARKHNYPDIRASSVPERIVAVDQEPQHAPAPHGVPLLSLRYGQCKYPLGDLDSVARRFCGARALDGKSWCSHHAALVYSPVQPGIRGMRSNEVPAPRPRNVDADPQELVL